MPWHASKMDAPFVFLDRAPDAPPPAFSNDQVSSIRSKPIRDLSVEDAYTAALERDTLQGYLDFLAVYPRDPMAPRVRAIVAARREAITWRRTREVDTPQAYWSYLRRYPRGPHVADAHRRLAYLAAASFACGSAPLPAPSCHKGRSCVVAAVRVPRMSLEAAPPASLPLACVARSASGLCR